MSDAISLIERGTAAAGRGAWGEARDCFNISIELSPSPEAYEGLSWAAWSLNDAEQLVKAREEAFRLYGQAQDDVGAARMAMWLGADYMDFRGELSLANGWRRRAERLLEGLPTAPEHGWLLLLDGDAALMAEEDAEKARDLGQRAVKI